MFLKDKRDKNTASAGLRVLTVERRICIIKERVHAEKVNLPYTYYPLVMLIYIISHTVTWLNVLPMEGGRKNISSRGLIAGTNISYNQHCRLPFGAYV